MKNVLTILFPIYINAITLTSLPDAAHMKIGDRLNISEVPYFASIWINKDSLSINLCGGAVIHEKVILSAAYCFGNERKTVNDNKPLLQYIKVVVGSTAYNTNAYNISKIIIHEKAFQSDFENNIALVITENSMLQAENVKQIAYPSQNNKTSAGTQATVYGIEDHAQSSSVTKVLLAAKVNITNQDICVSAYSGTINVTNDMVCAASEPRKGPCSKDTGGPFVENGYLIGIVSLGTACGLPTYPGIYVKVAHYHDWVENHLRNEFHSNVTAAAKI